jgi:hypothetical protein
MTMAIEIKIAKEKDKEEWDRLVADSPHGTITEPYSIPGNG